MSAPAAATPTMHELELILRPTVYCGIDETFGPCGFMIAKITVHAIRCASVAPSYGKATIACRISWTSRSASLGVQEHRNACVRFNQYHTADGTLFWLREDENEHALSCEASHI